MSFATSGYVIFLMGLTLLVILPLFIKSLSYKLVFKQIIFFAVMAIIFLGIIISSGILTIDIAETLILSRTIYRMPIELFDAAALDFLLKNPQCGLFGVGMGNIHIYAWHNLLQHALNNPYDSWVIPHAYNFAFIPNSGYLEIISGLGIIGLILFLSTGLIPIRFNLKYRLYTHDKNVNDTGLALSLFCPFILIVYLMRFYQINFVYITLGLLYFFNYKAREFCSICNENGFDA